MGKINIRNIRDFEEIARQFRLDEIRLLAVRAALRALPLIVPGSHRAPVDYDNLGRVIILVFRTNLISWFSTKYLTQDVSSEALSAVASLGVAANRMAVASAAAAATTAVALVKSEAAIAAAIRSVGSSARALAVIGADLALWQQIENDVAILRKSNQQSLVSTPLWAGGPEGRLLVAEEQFQTLLENWGGGWSVVGRWYMAIANDAQPFGLSSPLSEKLFGRLLKQDNGFWERDPDDVIYEVSLHVEEAWAENQATNIAEAQALEPDSGPGPQYGQIGGQLVQVAALPNDAELLPQAALLERVRKAADTLARSCQGIGNNHPELLSAITEYVELLSASDIDVVSLWAVGGALAGFESAFREQNRDKTLSNPLEPEVDGALRGLVRIHGAFIMGFAEARELIERADQFGVDRARLEQVREPGTFVLQSLAHNRKLIAQRTREFNQALSNYLHEFGWEASRAGYAGYLVVRNSVRAIIKLSVGSDPSVGAALGLIGGVSSLAGDPNVEFLRNAIPFLRDHASHLLAFFNHSPEMRAYVEWALQLIDDFEKTRRSEKAPASSMPN